MASVHPEGLEERGERFWHILVVDDEPDIHAITQLTLKRRKWRRRTFEITSCYTASEARELLRGDRQRVFHVAIIDVVMETRVAGLELCRYLRTEHPSSLRILLRTGQPGVAPEEKVLSDYDIDQYLSKPEITPERLFAAIRTCLRSSQDIETLLAFHRQLRNFSSALPSITSDDDLVVFMRQGLSFLELKHGVRISFIKSIDQEPDRSSLRTRSEAVARGHAAELTLGRVLPADALGMEGAHVLLFAVPGEPPAELRLIDTASPRRFSTGGQVRGGFVIEGMEPYMIDALHGDLAVFVRNWTTAHSALSLQRRVARDKQLSEAMYVQRMDRLARFVTGVANEINHPLDNLDAARNLIAPLAHGGERGLDSQAIAQRASETLVQNLAVARGLVHSLKQQVVIQLADDPREADLRVVVDQALASLRAEADKHNITLRKNWSDANKFPWIGVAGHLAQVVSQLVQNAIHFAYPSEGQVDIRLHEEGEGYRLEIEDHGVGLPKEVVARLLEPADGDSESRLGLPIANHIVTRLLRGQLVCTTEAGKGTRFELKLPRSQGRPT